MQDNRLDQQTLMGDEIWEIENLEILLCDVG
jgi:hypothetical protein